MASYARRIQKKVMVARKTDMIPLVGKKGNPIRFLLPLYAGQAERPNR